MPKRIAFTPRQAPQGPARPVERRIVFYVPGYDPDAERRYRTLFVRELRRYAKSLRIKTPSLTRPVTDGDGRSQTWRIEAEQGQFRTRTVYDVLLWSDLVRRDMARPYSLSACLNAWALFQVAASGTLLRLYRANWKCGNVILYPFAMSLLLLAAALSASVLGHGLLGIGLGLPSWIALLTGLGLGLWGVRTLAPRLDRAFLWQLMHDWIFHWQHAESRRADYLKRLDDFADHILARIAQSDHDEILIVGHSTGGLAAVELAARLLAKDARLGQDGPVLSLLTLGSSLPIVALQPRAHATRAAIARLMASPRLTWVDYQAPQDWLNFPGFNPLRDLSLGLSEAETVNPIIRSAKFSEIVDAATYRQIRLRPFRMHFQFLMANDHAGVFDIFALSLGSRCLRDRVLGDDSTPLGSGRSESPADRAASRPAAPSPCSFS
jgi:pimeloyl-ACP methyl ester carboxylesterase